MKTNSILALFSAALLLTGCKTPETQTAKRDIAAEIRAAVQAERARGAAAEERDMAGRSIDSDLSIDFNDDPTHRGYKNIKHKVTLGSNMDVTGLQNAEIAIHENENIVVRDGDTKEELSGPFKVRVSLGSYASADAKRAADEKRAMAEVVAAKAAGAGNILEKAYKGMALLMDAEGKTRVAMIDAKANQVAKIISTFGDSAGQVIDGVITFFPQAAAIKAAGDVLNRVRVKDSNGVEHEGILLDESKIGPTVLPLQPE